MDRPRIFPDPVSFDRRPELEQALAAWHGATLRLERTHDALRTEVLRLTDELEAKNRESARQSRRADPRQLASSVAHEVRNGLLPVMLYWKLLRRRLPDDPARDDILAKLESGLRAIDATVSDLLSFTSDRDPQLQWVDVRQVVDDVCASLAAQLSAQDVETIADVPRNLGVMADRKMLHCAVLNLASNALDAMPDGGRLVITSFIGPGGLELEVADSGPGLSEEVRRRAFDPFFSTKRGASGLGLAIVDRIAEVHGGDVLAANCPEGGAAFTLRFPSRAREAAA
ncbi:MAG: HAMP domain-containing histidine kinase [Planctomycetia bacterium]|nr:HAMP domain-containing histidine kinase [Planctomycetia bacterium]